ncbi:DUF4136 domain-containing protein [Vaginella massiliensis]|uniref:DUF4136 domain-containing protein n=1 Tax=Vaginella massiliensis TaxID=1816680 RepID=UPI000838164A|nr:DUF4136 domain-containing protein [Vaginella massiliensis]
MKEIKYILAIALIFTLVSCGVVQVRSDYDKTANFTAYKTYAFHEKGFEKLPLNDLDKRRIINALDQDLASKGFQKVNSNPDLIINVLASSKEQINIDHDYYGGWYGWGPYWGGPASRVSQYTSGTIIVDVIDFNKNILVFQSVGSGLNVSDISSKSERIPQAIQEIMKNFPPGQKK